MKKSLWLLMSILILLIFTAPCHAVSFEIEPNNDGATANRILSGESITGQLSSVHDQDWFSVCTSGSDVVQVTFTGNPNNDRPFTISIIDSSGNILSKKDHYGKRYNQETSQIFARVVASGIYFVIIEADTNLYENYTLSISLSNPGDCHEQTTQNGIEYDVEGIWQLGGQSNFLSLHVNNSIVVGVTYFPGAGESFVVGTITGNIGHITYSSDVSQFDATVTATSENTAILTINKCIPFPGDYCLFPAGLTVDAKKIF